MRRTILTAVALCVCAQGVLAVVIDGRAVKPVTTYSIVARDPKTGQLGVAVQSHWFSVGSVVPWVRAGVGAVATQSLTEVTYGPLGLALMAAGKTADQALEGLLRADATPQWRQVGMIDANGGRAVHTGRKCIREAGHVSGPNFICMANLMERPTVWDAMAEAFKSAEGDLADRMLAALEAAEDEGGDIRGRQSAALIVVTGEPTGIPYRDKIFDLRVDDHEDPVGELRRLLRINRAYDYMNQGDAYMTANDLEAATEAYAKAMELAPEITEIQFWTAITMFAQGHEEEALQHFKVIFAKDRSWMEVVRRLPQADLLENDDGQVDRILAAANDQ